MKFPENIILLSLLTEANVYTFQAKIATCWLTIHEKLWMYIHLNHPQALSAGLSGVRIPWCTIEHNKDREVRIAVNVKRIEPVHPIIANPTQALL